MPLAPGGDPGVSIYYECTTVGRDREAQDSPETSHKVVLIAGIGCAQDVWENEVEFMRKNCKLKGGLSICTFDNRGIGRSTCPLDKSEYSIDKMAKDVLALIGHLKWGSAHVVGHSMGSMIATRIAILAPEVVDSLTLIATCKRFTDLWPRTFKSVLLFMGMLFSPLDIEGRALLDLRCHFTHDYLEEKVKADEAYCIGKRSGGNQGSGLTEVSVQVAGSDEGGTRDELPQPEEQPSLTRRESLKREYMRKASIAHNRQPDHGFKGQMNACRFHFVSAEGIESLRQTSFPLLMIHGTQDCIIPFQAGQKFFLMLKDRSKFMLLHGAHFLSRERCSEVVGAILQQISEGLKRKKEHI